MFETNVSKVDGKERGSVLQQAEGKSRDGVREPLKPAARAAPSSAHGLFPPSIAIAGRTLADLMGLPALRLQTQLEELWHGSSTF